MAEYQTIVAVEIYRVRCPKCGLQVEVVPQLPSKAPFSEDFEDSVGLACESAAARQVARQFGLAAGTVRRSISGIRSGGPLNRDLHGWCGLPQRLGKSRCCGRWYG